MSKNYVDNKRMYEEIVAYKKAIRKALREKQPKPRIPEYIGECILLIARNLATKGNFSGYTYRDDMLSDGVENSIMYLENFNEKKYKNPFSYFTQIIYFAFIRRITREKKQTYIKQKLMEKMVIDDNLLEPQVDLDNEKMHDIVDKFETKKPKKVKVKVKKVKKTKAKKGV